MKKIYLMRHGQTLFNTMNVNQGQCDSPLTELGIHQAEKAAEWFRENDIRFDSVYSSSSERACDTCEIVTGGLPYTRSKRFKEIFLGTKEASPRDENPVYPYGDYFIQYGGEGLDGFTDRVWKALNDVAETDPHESILIVTHGMVIRRLLTVLPESKHQVDGFIGNCGILCLSYDHGSFVIDNIVNPN